jgi:hypothetical protein
MAGGRNLLTPSVACKVKSVFDDAVSRFFMFFFILKYFLKFEKFV